MLHGELFSRYMDVESQKCIDKPHNCLKHLAVKCTLYTQLSTYPRGPHFGPFLSRTRRFQHTYTRLTRIGNAPNDLTMKLNTQRSKVPCIHVLTFEAKFWPDSLYVVFLTTLLETLPRSIHGFLGVNLVCFPMSTKKGKFQIWNSLNNFSRDLS